MEILQDVPLPVHFEFVFPSTWSYGLIIALISIILTLFFLFVALVLMILTMVPSVREFTEQCVQLGITVISETWSGEREFVSRRHRVTEIRSGTFLARIYLPLEETVKGKQEFDSPGSNARSFIMSRVSSTMFGVEASSSPAETVSKPALAHFEPFSLADQLPDEILYKIFRYLAVNDNFSDLCRAALVCRRWSWISGDDSLWRPMFCRRWRVRTMYRPADVSRLPSDAEVAVVDWGPSDRPRAQLTSSRSIEDLFHAAGRSLWKGQYELAYKREQLSKSSASVDWNPISLIMSLTSIFETLFAPAAHIHHE